MESIKMPYTKYMYLNSYLKVFDVWANVQEDRDYLNMWQALD